MPINDKKDKKITSEKPVSLDGAKYEDVVGALLKTPKPGKNDREDKKVNNSAKNI